MQSQLKWHWDFIHVLVEVEELVLKFQTEKQKTWITKRNKVGGLTLSDFETNYKHVCVYVSLCLV